MPPLACNSAMVVQVSDGRIEGRIPGVESHDSVQLLCMPGRQVEHADGLEGVGHDYVPQMGLRTDLALEETIHGGGQQKGVDAAIAQHFPGAPGVFVIGKGEGQFLPVRPPACGRRLMAVVEPRPAPRPGEARHRLGHLRVWRDEADIGGQRRLPMASFAVAAWVLSTTPSANAMIAHR